MSVRIVCGWMPWAILGGVKYLLRMHGLLDQMEERLLVRMHLMASKDGFDVRIFWVDVACQFVS